MAFDGLRIAVAAALCCAAFPVGSRGQQAAPAAPPAAAQGAPEATRPRPLRIETRPLPNGLRLLVVEDHTAPVVNVQVWYHVGSKDERAGRTGFAHLFEHLMFKGSAHVGPEEHARLIEAAGGIDNAYTNDDATVFWESVPSNFLERVLWLEADRLGSLNVDEKNFQSEREVVKEERRQRVEDPPYGRVFEDLYAAAFTVHPYHHTTIGSMDDLNAASLDDVREFHNTFYRPDNATLIIVGDVIPGEAFAWTERYFGGIPRPAEPLTRQRTAEPPQAEERVVTKSYGQNSPLPAVVEGYKMSAAFTPDFYPLNLASNILSAGQSSRLYRKLVYDMRVALQAAGIGNFTEDPNLFLAFCVMNQGKSPEDGRAAIEAVLNEMKTDVSERELAKAKNQTMASVILGREGVQQTADVVGYAAVIGRNPELVNRDPDIYLRVSAADIQRVAAQYFVPSGRTVLIVLPTQPQQ